jgi:hypothetical protein
MEIFGQERKIVSNTNIPQQPISFLNIHPPYLEAVGKGNGNGNNRVSRIFG